MHPAFLIGLQGCIRVARHNIHARFTPPSKVEGREAVSQLTGVIFAKKEVHVIELNRVGAVSGHQIVENPGRSLRRLHTLCPSVGCMDTAEAAIEGAADAGMMDRGTLAKEGGPQVPGDRKAMEGRPGELVRAFHWPLGVGAMKAEGVFVAEAEDRFERSLSTQRVDQLKQSVFALAPDHIVDVLGVQRGVGIKRREVAAPDDAHVRAQAAYLTRSFHGGDHLRSGHAGNAK